MEGVTTAIVGFILLCVAFPKMVKHREQFYIAFILVLVVILLQSLAGMSDPAGGFRKFAIGFAGLFQIVILVALFMSCGAMSIGELTGDLGNAFEVIRRGQTEKEVIIPLTGEQPKPRQTGYDVGGYTTGGGGGGPPRPGGPA